MVEYSKLEMAFLIRKCRFFYSINTITKIITFHQQDINNEKCTPGMPNHIIFRYV